MYLTHVQTIYNNLGYINLNRGNDLMGISILAKAEKLGEVLLEYIQRNKYQLIHDFKE